MASFYGYPWGEPDDSGPEPGTNETGGPAGYLRIGRRLAVTWRHGAWWRPSKWAFGVGPDPACYSGCTVVDFWCLVIEWRRGSHADCKQETWPDFRRKRGKR